MSRGTLILVESPAKAKKIAEYLGGAFTVRASFGHICDLPEKDYGIDLASFEESYVARDGKKIAELRKLAQNYGTVLLASDPDREGEAIAWHLARELKLGRNAQRIEFNKVTKDAIIAAVQAPRAINMARVDAQRCRRVVDRIVGFDVSKEICWPAGAQSAGRTQTPALHILCERERQILSFVATTYFTVAATYGEGFTAFIPADPADAAPAGRDGDAEGANEDAEAEAAQHAAGRRKPRQFASQAEADQAAALGRTHPHIVQDVATNATFKRPEAPYITSTLQQDAARKLRLSVKQTMDLAQALYEQGYITYMRTDSPRVSDEGQQLARDFLAQHHPALLPAKPPTYRGKGNAQDAHEAIRPTHLEGDDHPPPGTADLYRMIKARFLASQCKPAAIERTTITISSGPLLWLAEGSVVTDPGYLVLWGPYAKQDDELLPAVAAQQSLTVASVDVQQKKTTPPPRFDAAGLVRKLEASGVGRPATFANIISTLLKRGYVDEVAAGRGKKVLQPTAFGMQVDELLTASVPMLVATGYTREMEDQLEEIEFERGPTRVLYLRAWYDTFRQAMTAGLPRAKAYCATHGLKPRGGGGGGEETKIPCDRCGSANYRKLKRKTGRGSFLACPECRMTRDVTAKVKPGGCKKCASALVEKRTAAGKDPFFGCVRYGAADRPCDYIEGADGRSGGGYSRAETTKPCPKCEAHKLVILTPKQEGAGQPFYACSDRACGFTLQVGARRYKDPCPECSGVLLSRVRKPSAEDVAAGRPGKGYWACAKCKFTLPMADSPVAPAT